jgi:putative addiction module killer protein
MGDAKVVGNGVTELRVHFGSGYRVYITQRGATLIVLLCGGEKRSQVRDIQRAIEMARKLEK